MFDDLHWADSSSVALVRHLIYRLAGGVSATPLFILAAARPDAVVETLRREQRCAVVELSPLNEFESAEMARRLGAKRVSPASIMHRTGGIPLLIEWSLRHRGQMELSTAFDAQLATLSPTCLAVLEWSALLVPDLDFEVLFRLGRWEADTLVAAVDEAVLAGVLTGDAENLEFVHPLLRQRCLRDIGPVAQARAHAQISRVLDRGAIVTLARHLVLAGSQADADMVAEVASAAGHEAWRACAWDEGAQFFEAALSAQRRRGRLGSPAEVAALHLGAGTCSRFSLDMDAARRHFEHAAALSADAGDAVGETNARRDVLACTIATGSVSAPDVDAVADLAAAIERSDPELAAEAFIDVSQGQWARGNVVDARATIERALNIARASNLPGAACRACISRAVANWIMVDLGGALDDLREAEEHARRANDSWRRTSPAYRLPLTLLWLGRLREARVAINRAAVIRDEVRSSYEFGLVLAASVGLAVLKGDRLAADEGVDQALRLQLLSDYRWASGLFLPTITFSRLAHGDVDGAQASLAAWSETADDRSRAYVGLLGDLVAVRGGLAGPEVLDRLPRLPSRPMLGAQDLAVLTIEIARVFDAPGPARRAVDLIDATLALGMSVSSGLAVLLARIAGDGHALIGDADRARAHYASAIQLAERDEAPVEAALSRLSLARLEAHHDRAAAAAALRTALRFLDRSVLLPARVDAAALADRLGVSTEPGSSQGGDPVAEMKTVLFVDVVDSTALTENLGDVAYRTRARALERGLRLAVAEHAGTAMPGVTLGDGLVALFEEPLAAILGAFAGIRAARQVALHVHVGLHHGTVLREGDATYGSTVNVGARICALSAPDEVLVSSAVQEILTMSGAGIEFVDRGTQHLKGVTAPQHLFAAGPIA